MTKYLLDTQTFLKLLLNSDDVNQNIKEDVEYFQHSYFVSIVSLQEFVLLKSNRKIITDFDLKWVITTIKSKQTCIIDVVEKHIVKLEKLPFIEFTEQKQKIKHQDPFDRLLIAQTIAEKMTVITTDSKFRHYEKFGLKVLYAN